MHNIAVLRVLIASIAAFVMLCCMSATSNTTSCAVVALLLSVVIIGCAYHVVHDEQLGAHSHKQSKNQKETVTREASLVAKSKRDELATIEVRPHTGPRVRPQNDAPHPPAMDTASVSPAPALHPYNPTVQKQLQSKLLMERQSLPSTQDLASMRDKFAASLAKETRAADPYICKVDGGISTGESQRGHGSDESNAGGAQRSVPA